MSQDLIFTTLPAGKTESDGKKYLKVSVFVSVQLKSSKETTLNSFPDLVTWSEKILTGEYSFRLSNGTEADAELLKENIDAGL